MRYRDADEPRWRRTSGRFALPPDVYNGMVPTLIRQLAPAAGGHFHVIAFTPHPRLVQVHVTSVRFAGFQGPLYYTGPVWRIEER